MSGLDYQYFSVECSLDGNYLHVLIRIGDNVQDECINYSNFPQGIA